MMKLKNGESAQLARTVKHDHLSSIEGDVLTYLPPVGSIIPFYDFNASLTFDSTKWKYCDGQNQTFTGIGSVATPDLSGRYLVGFGSDGAGDNDTAAWATSVVGNASNQISLTHSHTVNSHTHTVNSHTHTTPSHSHTMVSAGSHSHGGNTNGMSTSATENSPNYRLRDDSAGWVSRTTNGYHIQVQSGSNDEGEHDHDISSDGSHTHTVNSGGNGTSGSASPSTTTSSPGTDSQLSATQSIQPRSIRVRYLIRVA